MKTVQQNEPPAESLTGLNHGSRFRDADKCFNEKTNPNWSQPVRPSEQSEYGDIHKLIEKTKRELLGE